MSDILDETYRPTYPQSETQRRRKTNFLQVVSRVVLEAAQLQREFMICVVITPTQICSEIWKKVFYG